MNNRRLQFISMAEPCNMVYSAASANQSKFRSSSFGLPSASGLGFSKDFTSNADNLNNSPQQRPPSGL
jgi:hypothetical protein